MAKQRDSEKLGRPNPNSVSLAGEFAVLSQLSLRGYDANLTLGNTKNVDILVSNPVSGAMYKLEVKTTSRRSARGLAERNSRFWGRNYEWVMAAKHESVVDPTLFYCFVAIVGEEGTAFCFFIVPSKVVADYVRDQHMIWLQQDPKHKDNNLRQFRLAVDDMDRPLSTPRAAKYENNWSFNA